MINTTTYSDHVEVSFWAAVCQCMLTDDRCGLAVGQDSMGCSAVLLDGTATTYCVLQVYHSYLFNNTPEPITYLCYIFSAGQGPKLRSS